MTKNEEIESGGGVMANTSCNQQEDLGSIPSNRITILYKITWKEFEKIIQVLKKYKKTKFCYDKARIDRVLSPLLKVEKQPYNIKISLVEEDFVEIASIVDVWNAIQPSLDKECELISTKLQKIYFKTFNKHLFPKTTNKKELKTLIERITKAREKKLPSGYSHLVTNKILTAIWKRVPTWVAKRIGGWFVRQVS